MNKKKSFITICITCRDVELEKPDGIRYEWFSKTSNQAQMIKNVHETANVLHKIIYKANI